ncbi:MAG: hypothetical protein KC420_11405 [Myxococcales bacterium]|nr:hypothetical protein [Myxococcales bacterium]MCB9701570.1 hypothetical protein [Myxococcales bacterium]
MPDEDETNSSGELSEGRELAAIEESDSNLVLALLESDGNADPDADPDADADAAESAGDDEAAADFVPRACVHSLDEKRPRITKSAQLLTKRIIRHTAKRMGVHEDFRKLLALIALRESSYQSGLVHRLSPDLNASYSSWRKMSARYEDNPHASDPTLWQTYGLFGMNSNYFTLLWDQKADPRVLCDPIVDIILYRRAAERALRKMLSGPIRCKGQDGDTFDITVEPTWGNIHRAVSGGKICPSKHEERAATMRKYFDARARRVGIDPNARVSLKMLGKEPGRGLDGETWEGQEAMVTGLWKEIDAGADDKRAAAEDE